MTRATDLPALLDPLGYEQILANATSLAPWLRAAAARIEEQRRLPDDVVDALKRAGVFRLCMPRIWGGPELTSMQQVEVIAELARGDASAAWCVMIGCDVGLYSAWLDPDVARAMYPRLDMVQAGWVYPIGRAERVAGGYRVSGDWMFGSGCQHSDWMAGGCWVHENGEQTAEWRLMLAPRDDWEILDTWYTTGLRGTGSTDYRCRDLFVPEERTFSFFEPPRRDGTLYRGHEALLRKMAGIPLGVGRAAIDDAIAILEDKLERPLNRPYREMPRVQAAVAEAEALWGAARAYLFRALEAQWAKLERGEPPTVRERADVWLSRTNVFQSARSIARSLYDVVGGGAVYAQRSPFDRYLRDTETMCQHVVGQPKGYEAVGALLLDPAGATFHPML
ncbi:MAG TPA: acyl-CoA dehydrogenase family protein [Candidatus Dormibacteraeota bacterium]|nr:acyl-CoA dehydrogenase family protein [Candidatus Dormibacteraeota bacterium]